MRQHYSVSHERGDQYFVRTDPQDPEKIEMSFDLSAYQPQLAGTGRHVYQTIFLDDTFQNTWSMPKIDPGKELLRKWWRQFAPVPSHFLKTLPLLRFMNGKKHTWYAGNWTLFNTHEICMISGLAAAHRLGAPYPFGDDPLATKQFELYLKSIHGVKR